MHSLNTGGKIFDLLYILHIYLLARVYIHETISYQIERRIIYSYNINATTIRLTKLYKRF